jgi:hypothetical protein
VTLERAVPMAEMTVSFWMLELKMYVKT